MSATENELGLLHAAVARALAEKIASGEATASDFTNALKMLKDNNITCAPGKDNAMGELQSELEAASAVAPADLHDLQEALDNVGNVTWLERRGT